MATNKEISQVDVIINGQKANATLNEFRGTVRALNAELNKIPDPLNSPEFAKGKKAMDELKIKIDEITGKVKQTEQATQKMADTFGGKLTKSMSGMGDSVMGMVKSLGAAYLGWETLKETFISGVKNAIEEESALRKLTYTLNGNSKAAEELTQWKMKTRDTTMFSKNEIGEAMQFALNMNHGTAETKKMVEAALSLNKATGGMVDVMTAMQQLQLTYQGDIGRIKKYTGALTEEQLKNGAAVDVLIEKYGRFMTEGMNSTEGSLKRIKDNWEELTESIGKKFLPVLDVALVGLNALIRGESVYAAIIADAGMRSIADGVAMQNRTKMIGLQVTSLKELISTNKEFAGQFSKLQKSDEWKSAGKDDRMQMSFDLMQKYLSSQDSNLAELKRKEKEYATYIKKIRDDLNTATVAGIQNEHERELKMAELDFNNKIQQIKGHSKDENALRVALKDEYERKVSDINKKYSDEEIKKHTDQIQKLFDAEKGKWEARIKADDIGSAEWFLDSKAFLDMQEKWELDQVGNVENAEQLKYEIRQKYLLLNQDIEQDLAGTSKTKKPVNISKDGQSLRDRSGIDKSEGGYAEKVKLLEQERDIELAIAGDNAEQQKIIWEQFYAGIKSLNLDLIQNLLNTSKEAIQTLSTIYNAISAYENQQLQKDTQVNDQKKINLKQQLDHKAISQKDYDKKVEKMDLDLDAKKREIAHKQAVRQKEIAVFNATIAFLQAIIQAANIAPPADIIMPIIIAALMGVQLAALIATPVPAAAEGRYNVIGQSDGKAYNDVPYQESFTGIPGRPMLVNETGNEIVIDPKTTRNLQINYPEVINAIKYARVPQMAQGLYPSSVSSSGTSAPMVLKMDPEYIAAIKEHSQLLKKPAKSYLVWQDLKEANDKMDIIIKDTTP